MRTATRKENKLQWFVMTCRQPEKVEAYLDEYNADVEHGAEDKVSDSFIPSLAIKRRKVTRGVDEDQSISDVIRHREDKDRRSNEVRGSVRKFVFLQVRPSGLEKIRRQPWNLGDIHLWHYRDGEGEEITVRDDMMRRFMNGCLEYGEKFELRTKDADITDGIKVTVREGEFKGFEGEIYNVHFKGEGVRFSIAIKFFANNQYIHIHDRTPDFVTLPEQESLVFNASFIDRIESSLITILSRRVNKKTATADLLAEEDQQLHNFYCFRHVIIDDPHLNLRLDALMSICATLSKNNQEKSKYNRILKDNIKLLHQQVADTPHQTALAYQLTALYLSTKDATYRDELKPLILHQLPHHSSLHQLLSLLRR